VIGPHRIDTIEYEVEKHDIIALGDTRRQVLTQTTYVVTCTCGQQFSSSERNRAEEMCWHHVHNPDSDTVACGLCNKPVLLGVAVRVSAADTGEVKYICPGHVQLHEAEPEPDIDFVRQDLLALERELRP
jgi:hypothetical protein